MARGVGLGQDVFMRMETLYEGEWL
uniref:Uncharacterized protein n=1 Tax=Anguilla anguilla TaxID=7936 RepID=A0A0E9VIC1_ANGAN